MTIAIGILAEDGLVVAADTEESDGYLKTAESKIRKSSQLDVTGSVGGSGVASRAKRTAASAIAGAGTSGYIDSVTPSLWGPCLAHSKASDETFMNEIGGRVAAYYREHVIPFASYPSNERPEFELLLAVTHRGAPPQDRHRVFVTDRTTIRRCSPYAAIGVGGMFAQMLLKRLYPNVRLDTGAAAALAAYIAFQVKESVPGCGKYTEIVALHNGASSYVPWVDVRDMETVFLRHAKLEGTALACALALDQEGNTQTLRALATAFRKFRTAFGKLAFTKRGWMSDGG